MKMTTVYGAYAPPRAMLGTLPTFYLILPKSHGLSNKDSWQGVGRGLP